MDSVEDAHGGDEACAIPGALICAYARWLARDARRTRLLAITEEYLLLDDAPEVFDAWAALDDPAIVRSEVRAAFDTLFQTKGLPSLTDSAAIWITIDAALEEGQSQDEAEATVRDIDSLALQAGGYLELFGGFVYAVDLLDDPVPYPVDCQELIEEARAPVTRHIDQWFAEHSLTGLLDCSRRDRSSGRAEPFHATPRTAATPTPQTVPQPDPRVVPKRPRTSRLANSIRNRFRRGG